MWHIVGLCVTMYICLSDGQVCEDVDTTACIHMEKTSPGLCDNLDLASLACPRYCKLCPLTCFACESHEANVTACRTIRQCDRGQRCMSRRVTSTSDGHHEYSLKCGNLDECDGNYQMAVFGRRRSVIRRNVNVQCCESDFCNLPHLLEPDKFTTTATSTTARPTTAAPTTTTLKPTRPTTTPTTTTSSTTAKPPCSRDIGVLIEDVRHHRDSTHDTFMLENVRNLLVSVVYELDIGTHSNLFELTTFDTQIHRQFDFSTYRTKTGLIEGLNALKTNQKTNHFSAPDLINFIKKEAFARRSGERPEYPNVVIVFADHRGVVDVPTTQSPDDDDNLPVTAMAPTTGLFSRMMGDVIVIDVGGNQSPSAIDQLATDESHILRVDGYDTLYTIRQPLIDLICN